MRKTLESKEIMDTHKLHPPFWLIPATAIVDYRESLWRET